MRDFNFCCQPEWLRSIIDGYSDNKWTILQNKKTKINHDKLHASFCKQFVFFVHWTKQKILYLSEELVGTEALVYQRVIGTAWAVKKVST